MILPVAFALATTDAVDVGAQPFVGQTVQQVAAAAGCSTTAVFGLSKQIVDEVNCLVPNAWTAVPSRPNLVPGAATFAFLQPPAEQALVNALDANPGMTMHVDSMLRTVAQQYLLYAWYQAGQCGIQLAATPGTSNHEQGLAFDTPDYSAWMNALQSNEFKWFGSSDVVHFDFVGTGSVDLSGKDVLAFQKLWNLNNPGDLIAEDGSYGPATEARLQQSPADGFAQGVSCGSSGDAGADAGPAGDAGSPAPPGDDGGGGIGLPSDDASAGGEAGATAETPAPDYGGSASGCACRAAGARVDAPGARGGGPWAAFCVAMLTLAAAIRRRP